MTIGATSGFYPNNYMYTAPLGRPSTADTQAVGMDNAKSTDTEDARRTAVNGTDKAEKHSPNPDAVKKPGKRSAPEDCETCKNRKYQDGSDEGNVSFKAAAHISPESAAARVRAHENEHVSNAYKKAAQKNGEVVNASVSIHTATCPECGRTYVSGGTTNTTIRYSNEQNPYVKEQKARDAVNMRGANIDYAA